MARVPWEEASDLHRSSLLAWQADFLEESYRHLRDIYHAVIARGRHQPALKGRVQLALPALPRYSAIPSG